MYHSNYWNWSGTDTICLSENLMVILYPLLHALDTADATHSHNLLNNQILIYLATICHLSARLCQEENNIKRLAKDKFCFLSWLYICAVHIVHSSKKTLLHV